MKIALREAAVVDLENIRAFIAQDSPRNADKVLSRIWAAINDLILPFPEIGRAGQVPGTRELPVHGLPYLIVYEPDEARNIVTILNVFHTSRDR
jgi:plasmid stabilization system protein ParE